MSGEDNRPPVQVEGMSEDEHVADDRAADTADLSTGTSVDPERPTALQVADYIIARAAAEGETLEPSKLQALLYLSQACHLAVTGRPLFDDSILAGPEGPYVESVEARLATGVSAPAPVDDTGPPAHVAGTPPAGHPEGASNAYRPSHPQQPL